MSLRQALLNHSADYLGTFSESILAYGLGRVLDSYDMPAVRAVARDAAKNDNRFSSFILGVVKSTPFQMRRVEENESVPTDAVAAGHVAKPVASDSRETAGHH